MKVISTDAAQCIYPQSHKCKTILYYDELHYMQRWKYRYTSSECFFGCEVWKCLILHEKKPSNRIDFFTFCYILIIVWGSLIVEPDVAKFYYYIKSLYGCV